MTSYYKGNIPIIADGPATDLSHPVGESFGLVPRDYSVDPPEMFASPSEMSLIPESEWDARFDEQERMQSSLEHIFLSGRDGAPAFVNLDQNGDGYCWAYSTGHAIMMTRLKNNAPLIRLNPHATAAIIKGGRNEGGWCGLSAKFARENGYAVEGNGPGQWPLHSRSLSYDTPALRVEMAKHKVSEEWVDLTRSVYEQNLTVKQLATCLFSNQAGPVDFNWWGHSVCAIRWVRIERGSWGPLILNSWKGWGRYGLSVLQGTKGRPDGALSVLVTDPSSN
jgi:hypothetical protein